MVYHLDWNPQKPGEWKARVKAMRYGQSYYFVFASHGDRILSWQDENAPLPNNRYHFGAEITPEKSSKMKIETFTRRPFDVQAVQVTPTNAAEIAEWCGGKIGKSTYKLAGFDTPLDIVLVPGNGPNAGKMVEAKIGSYVANLDGKFRVLRKAQFHEMFFKAPPAGNQLLRVDDLVEIINPDSPHFRCQGQIELINQTCITIPGEGGILCDPSELKGIEEYSEETKQKVAEVTVPGLDKINELRQDAEKVVMSGSLHETLTEAFGLSRFEQDDLVKEIDGNGETGLVTVVGCSLDGETDDHVEVLFGDKYSYYLPSQLVRVGHKVPSEINGIKVDSIVRVRDELNEFFSQCGRVEAILTDNMFSVQMEMSGNPIVKHLVREVELEEATKWVEIINPDSPQAGWVGWVVQDAPVGELVRVAFRPVNYLDGARDKCFSYMGYELEQLTHAQLGQIPAYEI